MTTKATRHAKSTAANRRIALNQLRSVRRHERHALALIRRAFPDGTHVRWAWDGKRMYEGIVVGFRARETLDASVFLVRYNGPTGTGKPAIVSVPLIVAQNAPKAKRRKRT